ncbi:ABC transporter ATP-binding protein [Ectopseudomonas mendocina]|uniref:ABC transporter ATP-binding protein n=1 Tax=Ectopseudomonas mendocina TaxID=300 RepID=A0ABZ2RG47_ECTME
MLKTFIQLLGDQRATLHRYLLLAVIYAVLCGLTILTVVPVLNNLLAQQMAQTGLWLLLLLVEMLLCWGLRRQVEKAGIRVGIAVLQGGRHRLGEHVASLPVGWFNAHNSGRISHVAGQGMMGIAQLPAHVFTPLLTGVVTPLVIMLALLVINPPLGLIAALSLPLLVLVFVLSARAGLRADEAYQASTADASQRMLEFAQAQAMLRAFNGEQGGSRFLEQAISQQQSSAHNLIQVSAMSVLLNSWAVQVCFAALLIAAVLGLGQSVQAQAPLIVSLLLAIRFAEPLLDVAGYSEVLRGVRGQLQVVANLFAQQPLAQPESAQQPADASVELQVVSFRYADDQADVLRDVSLRVAPGSMTALVGASGSGKTTLVRLIARFFEASQGCVRIGGVDVRQMSSQQLAGQISQIFQDAYLFQGSIADNIRLGKPEATDAELQAVIELAAVSEIIQRLPNGLATQVGEGGARLSGGERQRICIARALLKDAPILLVDEATAALDTENQAAITAVLQRLRGSRTLIVIAHQLSTVAMADQIVVLLDGRIVEHGSHQQLQAAQGAYAHFLAQRQAARGWQLTQAQDGEVMP